MHTLHTLYSTYSDLGYDLYANVAYLDNGPYWIKYKNLASMYILLDR